MRNIDGQFGGPFVFFPISLSFAHPPPPMVCCAMAAGGASRRRSTGAGGRETLSAVLGRVVASVEGSSVVEYEVELGYDDLPLDQVGGFVRGRGSGCR